MRFLRPSALAVFALAMASMAIAQQPQQQPDSAAPTPAIGEMAPDFSFRPISREGIAPAPKKLSDYRGQTVVLWFFIKARTRG
ncbi:MAG: hypothetical protein ACREOK_16265 [Gemmatimonadaceae bacterium]